MSKIGFYYEDALKDISKEINRLEKSVAEPRKMFEMISDILKMSAVTQLTKIKSKVVKSGHTHFVDDIVSKVKTSKRGDIYASLHGGRKTGYKWAWVNDGHYSNSFIKGAYIRNGKFKRTKGRARWIAGNHFMDAIWSNAQAPIERVIDDYLEEVIK